ncbi:MAG: tetratricopeptide repeat protein [Devosia sp.]
MRGWFRAVLGAALLAATPTLAEPSVTALGAAAATTPSSPAEWVQACGDDAGSPFEFGREGRGVADNKDLLLQSARTVCEEALRQSPGSPDVSTWLARIYLAIDRGAEAVQLLETGAAAGNAFALTMLSEALINPYGYGIDGDYARGQELQVAAAETGFAPAQVNLAKAYEAGSDIEQNYEEAYRLYGLAAAQGHPFALFKLGYNYHVGLTVGADVAEAMRWYQAAADAGAPEGLNGIAQLYEFGGEGVTQDYALAADYHQRAADLGNAASQAELGFFYEQGHGVEADPVKAVEWLEKAAGQGNAYAQASLAIHYLFGPGVEIDVARGFNLAEAAASQGSVFGESILGFLYAEGMGTERDLSSAVYHFQLAADQGDTYSQNWIPVIQAEQVCADQAGSQYELGLFDTGQDLGAIDVDAAIGACQNALSLNPNSSGDKAWLGRAYFAAGDFGNALPMIQESAEAGNPLGQTLLAEMLRDGTGVPSDAGQSLTLLQAAAEKEFEPAMFALGQAYERGLGVTADIDLAINWYRRAAVWPMPEAVQRLQQLGSADGSEIATEANGFGKEPPAPY